MYQSAMIATMLILLTKALMWAGVALVAFALAGDAVVQRVKRRRGTARPRCPKCWYDLSPVAQASRLCGSPDDFAASNASRGSHGRHARASETAASNRSDCSITCSECGHRITREGQLFRGRKRWSLAAAAIALLMASHVLNVLPDIRQRGIIAAVPTTALILAMPWLGSPYPAIIDDEVRGQITIKDELSQEFFARVYDCGRSWRWQERLIVERALRGDRERRPLSEEWFEFYDEVLFRIWDCAPDEDPDPPWLARAEALVQVHAHTRPIWPVGVPVYARVEISRWLRFRDHVVMLTPRGNGLSDVQLDFPRESECGFGGLWNRDSQFLGVPDEGVDAIEYEVSIADFDYLAAAPGRVLRTQPLRIPIQFVDSVDDILEPIESNQLTQYIASQLDPVLLGALTSDECTLRLWRSPWLDLTHELIELNGVTVAFAIEAMRGGVVVGEARAWFKVDFDEPESAGMDSPQRVLLWQQETVRMDWFDRAEARFAEDAVWTLRLRGDPYTALRNFESDRYWRGEIEVPLRLDVWAER